MKRIYLFLSLLICISSLSVSAKPGRQEMERDVREAAFRYQFKHNASGQQQGAAFYFLAVGQRQQDPSDEFMRRFKNHRPPVKKVSQSVRGEGSQVLDKATGKHGLIFFTTELKWLSGARAQIKAGYSEANLSAGSNTYILEKRGGKWHVIKDIQGPIA